jgi:ABC-type multidrug transport system ATPase subunit
MQSILDAVAKLNDNQSLILGSGDSADIVVSGPGVENEHVRFSRRGTLFLVQDLDSSTGTFLNGQEVHGRAEVRPGDRLHLGDLEFIVPFLPITLTDKPMTTPSGSPMAVSMVGATKTIRTGTTSGTSAQAILDHVSFRLVAGQFLGVLGASGSGKSTLIKAVAGLAELSNGTVLLNDKPTSALALCGDRRIAYLPQDVVIHESLSPLVALNYVARLKGLMPAIPQRKHLVHSVLERVGLWEHRDTPIHRLSGGQRKRAALAAELLGDPRLILLDEATSGLDPATEEGMMHLFRSLAREGRTVICITHSPGRLHLCDRILYLIRGKAVFFGSPDDLRRFFEVSSIEDVYSRQSELTAEEWEARFHQSAAGKEATTHVVPRPTGDGSPPQSTPASVSKEELLTQTATLVSRYFRLHVADWKNLLLLFAQAPVIGLMVGLTFGVIKVPFAELHAANTKQVFFVMVLAVLWCSGTCSVREIVKEMPILQHEARFGVRLGPYLISKLLLLGALSLTQTAALLLVVRSCTRLTGTFDLQFLILGLTALAGVALGLLVSAIAGSSERAMTLLPVLLIAQAILSDGLAQLTGWVRGVAMLFVSAYWSLDGLKAPLSSDLLNATYPGAPGHYQPPILGSGGPLVWSAAVLLVHTALLLLATQVVLGHQIGSASSHLCFHTLSAWIARRKRSGPI